MTIIYRNILFFRWKGKITLMENLAVNIEQSIETIKNSIRELLKQHKELLENFQLLLTIPGIGEESAIAILAEIPGRAYLFLYKLRNNVSCHLYPK